MESFRPKSEGGFHASVTVCTSLNHPDVPMTTILTILSALCLAAAVGLHMVIEQSLAGSRLPRTRDAEGSLAQFISILALPMWGLLAVPVMVEVHRGALDWISDRRLAVYLIALGGHLLLGVATWISLAFQDEPRSLIPRGMRLLVPLGIHIIPPTLIASLVVHLAAPETLSPARVAAQLTVGVVGAWSACSLTGLLVQKLLHLEGGSPAERLGQAAAARGGAGR